MSLVLEGTLTDVGLCDLLRLIAREKRAGSLRVTIDGVSYLFALADGQLADVRCDEDGPSLDLDTTVLMLVRHRRGAFRLEPARGSEPAVQADGGIHAEVLAGAGEMELIRLEERLALAGGEGSHPERADFPKPGQMEGLDTDARAVFALVNGERSLAELVVRSRLDPARALDALDELAAQSLVQLEVARDRPPLQVAPLVERAAGAWRDWIAAAVPLAMLGLWMVLAGSPTGGASADPFAIVADPLAAARAAHEVERLRAAVEAHRFAEGRFPEQLQTLVQRGYLPASALTDAHGRPYYYARRGDEFVLLAPER